MHLLSLLCFHETILFQMLCDLQLSSTRSPQVFPEFTLVKVGGKFGGKWWALPRAKYHFFTTFHKDLLCCRWNSKGIKVLKTLAENKMFFDGWLLWQNIWPGQTVGWLIGKRLNATYVDATIARTPKLANRRETLRARDVIAKNWLTISFFESVLCAKLMTRRIYLTKVTISISISMCVAAIGVDLTDAILLAFAFT